MSRMYAKQGLVEEGMYREQENSHLEWPDHAKGFTGFTVCCSNQEREEMQIYVLYIFQ